MESQKAIYNDTLVRYNNPVVVSNRSEEAGTFVDTKPQIPSASTTSNTDVQTDHKNQSIKDVLNCIFPPREWEENGKRWIQTVSSEPVTKKSVVDLEESLDAALRKENARDTGICPIRRKLFDQCFDELIRQEAVSCCDRGLLMKMVRDNLRTELNTLETLYISSIAYGLRKTLLVEEETLANIEHINVLKEWGTSMENEIKELNSKIVLTELNEAEKRKAAEEEHQREVELLKQENQKLRENLEKAIYPKK